MLDASGSALAAGIDAAPDIIKPNRAELAEWTGQPLDDTDSVIAAVRDLRAVGILTFGAAVGPFIGVALNMVALRYAPSGIVATIIATMPVLVLPFSILVYHEKVSLRAVGGAIVAVAGVAMLML